MNIPEELEIISPAKLAVEAVTKGVCHLATQRQRFLDVGNLLSEHHGPMKRNPERRMFSHAPA